jgi:hypothetical protein
MKRHRCSPVRPALLAGALALLRAPTAFAEPEPAVDVTIHDTPRPERNLAIAYSPLPLILGKISLDVVVVPTNHHALVLSPFWASATTAPVTVFDDMGAPTRLPEQRFRGWGGEIGYRYYWGEKGPRGLFVGPSLLLGRFSAGAADGSSKSYGEVGLAGDVGYQALVADRVSVTLGGGLQLAHEGGGIPPQQFPARFFANSGVWPRLLAAVGVAF